MNRRSFLKSTLASFAALGTTEPTSSGNAYAWGERPRRSPELQADIGIIGGGLGGCAAALAALRHGFRVVLTEETDWLGGQLTQQAVPPDEHPWIESFGATRSYRQLRSRIRDYYLRNYPLTANARARWNLNPGQGSVSALCHEPRAALAALGEWLAPFQSSGRLRVLHHCKPASADTTGDRVDAVQLVSLKSGQRTWLSAPYFLDATELGDLLPLTGTEFRTGFESHKETGEPHGPAEPQPENVQAFTWCFAMDHLAGQNHTIDKPRDYAFWREYIPLLKPPWPGPLLSWPYSHPITLEPRRLNFQPNGEEESGQKGLWTYRRIAYRKNFTEDFYPSDICLVNWPHNDYWLGNLIGASETEAQLHLERAKQLSLSLLYWLQTEAPRADGGQGWPGLRIRPDVVGTEDGLAKHPYIRESRRIKAEFTVLEQHVGAEARMKLTGKAKDEVSAEVFPDSVGVGSYRIDLHPSTGGDSYIDISSLPFQIPLGALIPQRVENLLPACKNLGVTHITNGCYRLHPVEWNIGESSGLLVAYCLNRQTTPRQVRNQVKHLEAYQQFLSNEGVEIAWPKTYAR
ncbi:MAG: FAD-dependent oxidoreductase [Acidobacteriota bacterium]